MKRAAGSIVLLQLACLTLGCTPRDEIVRLSDSRAQAIVVEGWALDSKGGAVVCIGDSIDDLEYIYIVEGLDGWPKDVWGKTVRVRGYLTFLLYPEPKDPLYSARGGGLNTFLSECTWKVVDKKKSSAAAGE